MMTRIGKGASTPADLLGTGSTSCAINLVNNSGAAPSRAILGSSRHIVCTHSDPIAACGCAVSPKAVLIRGAIVLNPGDGGCCVIVAPRIPCSRGRHLVLDWGVRLPGPPQSAERVVSIRGTISL